jgi:pyruvate kinase
VSTAARRGGAPGDGFSYKSHCENNMNINQVFEGTDVSSRKTKVICTMGPACWDVETLCEMLKAGMNVARLNFSHGDHESHGATVKRIREAMAKTGINCGLLLDTKGPEIRSGFLEGGGKVELQAGQTLKIVTDYEFKGNKDCIACSYKSLPTTVKVGSTIFFADGSLTAEVTELGEDFVNVVCKNSCSLGERKNMNLPGAEVDLPTLTPQDEKDIVDFGLPNDIDFIAASFVRKASDLDNIRKVMGPAGAKVQIISKIEN